MITWEFFLRGIERDDSGAWTSSLQNLDLLNPIQNLKLKLIYLKKEEGGRHTPFFTKYRPQFYFRTTDVTGEVTLPEGTEMIMPGDDAKMTVTSNQLLLRWMKILNFAIREGGRTVGAGVVTKVIE